MMYPLSLALLSCQWRSTRVPENAWARRLPGAGGLTSGTSWTSSRYAAPPTPSDEPSNLSAVSADVAVTVYANEFQSSIPDPDRESPVGVGESSNSPFHQTCVPTPAPCNVPNEKLSRYFWPGYVTML